MNVECPYCEKNIDINHDDGFGYEEGVKHQTECPYCEKSFVFETAIVYYAEPQKADCLNGGNHDFKLTSTFPREWSKMECSMCGKRRDLTDEELTQHGIKTKQEYINSLKN